MRGLARPRLGSDWQRARRGSALRLLPATRDGRASLGRHRPGPVSRATRIAAERLMSAAAQALLYRRGMREILDITVGELMSTPAVTVASETSIEALTELMTKYDYNGFPVVTDTGTLVGLVTRTDLFKVYLSPYRNFIPAIEDTWVSSVGAIMSRGVITLYPVE